MNSTINIPDWVARNTELNWNEKALYAVYHYFTFFGEYKCCKLTVAELCNRLGLEERTIQRCKKHLKELCFISTDGGITTTALIRGDKNDTPGVTKIVVGGDKNDTHNREINKDINIINIDNTNNSNFNKVYRDIEELVQRYYSTTNKEESIALIETIYNKIDNDFKVVSTDKQFSKYTKSWYSRMQKSYNSKCKQLNWE